MKDIASLRERARTGLITDTERRSIASAIQRSESPLYELVDISGWAAASSGPTSDEIVALESALKNRQDSMVPGLALTILAIRWGLADRYKAVIEEFLGSPAWDLEGNAQLAAINAVPRLHLSDERPRIVQRLLSIFRDSRSLPGTRQAAYSALAALKGMSLVRQINSRLATPNSDSTNDEVLKWSEAHSKDTQ